MKDKKILEQIKKIDKDKTPCCDLPKLYYIGIDAKRNHYFEPWDFCPSCLECC